MNTVIHTFFCFIKFCCIRRDFACSDEAEKGVNDRIQQLLNIKGNQSVESFHRRLGKIMWEYCGMARNAEGLTKAVGLIRELRAEYYKDVFVPGSETEFNPELEKALRVADFIELGELMCIDALNRNESCGGHFRDESQENGEAKRDDENFAYTAAWEYGGDPSDPILNKEPLVFEEVKLQTRVYA